MAILQTGIGKPSDKFNFTARQWVEIGTLSSTPITQYRCNTPISGFLAGTTNEIEVSAIIATFTDKTVKVFNSAFNNIESNNCYFVIFYRIV